MSHANNPQIIARLKRIEGHLRSIITMVEEGRDCLDIAQQLQAVDNAVTNAKKQMIQHHIGHCIEDTLTSGVVGSRGPLEELKALAKYL